MEKYNRLKVVLAEKGIQQKELAKMLGKNLNTISAICNNKQQPHLKDLFKIAEALGVNPKDLINS